MRYRVIIDQSIKKSVPLVKDSRIPSIISSDIKSAIQEDLAGKGSGERGFIVFLPPAKLPGILSFFNSVKTNAVFQRLIVMVEKKGVSPAALRGAEAVAELRAATLTRAEYRFIVKKYCADIKESFQKKKREREDYRALLDAYSDQEDLITIGRALSLEKNIDNLFRKILGLSLKITGADAGSIYIVEEKGEGEKQIRVKYADTFSKKISFEESLLPFNTSTIAGYVAVTGNVLNIPDVYKLTPQDPVSFDPRFDRKNGYRTKSMLVVPMRNHFDKIIGVIQLINSKEDFSAVSREGRDPYAIMLAEPEDYDRCVVPFKNRYNRLLEAVAGQAGIAIEHARMITQIRYQFEEFVKASVFAIESRDEATSGHSFRVAALCAKMAEAINKKTSGPLKDVKFSEIERKELEYAALLHDYGKVYLDMRIFTKAKKLYPEDFDALMKKIEIAFRQAEMQSLAAEVALLRQTADSSEKNARLTTLQEEQEERRKQIRAVRGKIRLLNEPTVAVEDPRKTIEEIMKTLQAFECSDLDGNKIELFSPREKSSLEITRGSLNNDERRVIESHVEHTYHFVSKIPWPKEFERIPEIAHAHHELLDGSGYPRRLKGKEHIPLEARVMAIADIFDALTARDRPYKKAIPVEKALLILQQEVDAGKLDPDLFKIFRDEHLWET
jgi:HD-GYP domain-containing protein (c-di-GMP phosphodiesterase class II)